MDATTDHQQQENRDDHSQPRIHPQPETTKARSHQTRRINQQQRSDKRHQNKEKRETYHRS